MLLNQDETMHLYDLLRDSMNHSKNQQIAYSNCKELVEFYKEREELCKKLKEFILTAETLIIEEGPF